MNLFSFKTIPYEEIELKSVKNNYITEKSSTLYYTVKIDDKALLS